MSRFKSLVTAGLIASTLALTSIGGAGADPTPALNENPGNGPKTDNCVGVLSAASTGNGANIRYEGQGGTRGELVQWYLDDSCGE